MTLDYFTRTLFGRCTSMTSNFQLAGWGSDDIIPDTGTEHLMTVDLPYISYSACVGQLQHITLDKFCAGSPTGKLPLVLGGNTNSLHKYLYIYFVTSAWL